MRAEPTCLRCFAAFTALLLGCAGCAAVTNISVPAERSAQSVPVPSVTRVLGQAAIYISAVGERLEVVRDVSAGIAIVKLPDGSATALPEEIAGSGGRYRDRRMTVWETDGVALLWIDGKLVFSGKVAE